MEYIGFWFVLGSSMFLMLKINGFLRIFLCFWFLAAAVADWWWSWLQPRSDDKLALPQSFSYELGAIHGK